MKKIMYVMGAIALMLCTSCVKEKNCRCTVAGGQDVRIVTIKRGDCSKLNSVNYFDALDTMYTQEIVCTDYPFLADSLIVIQ
ncbi:MAG: hypothetical protein MJZ99_06775 [Bacteroidales bacterium]|nr:hypothetical protein [Candidatus Colimorpha merdihippi]MCQ2282311.1 hypothetical protein [Bacteroidales bacterium]